MPRPRLGRTINFDPKCSFYKPQSVPMKDLEIVELSHEEMEALRLKFIEELDQNACALKMQTSQSTFQRILSNANKKVTHALVKGQAIKIINSKLDSSF